MLTVDTPASYYITPGRAYPRCLCLWSTSANYGRSFPSLVSIWMYLFLPPPRSSHFPSFCTRAVLPTAPSRHLRPAPVLQPRRQPASPLIRAQPPGTQTSLAPQSTRPSLALARIPIKTSPQLANASSVVGHGKATTNDEVRVFLLNAHVAVSFSPVDETQEKNTRIPLMPVPFTDRLHTTGRSLACLSGTMLQLGSRHFLMNWNYAWDLLPPLYSADLSICVFLQLGRRLQFQSPIFVHPSSRSEFGAHTPTVYIWIPLSLISKLDTVC